MKISEQWLRQWANPNIDTHTLSHQLTMLGLEIDGIHAPSGKFTHVVVGRILEAQKHPEADRLRVCKVSIDDSQPPLTIVCGAPNAREGIFVAVAMIGAILPNGMEIKHAKLRGVESQGMLCSSDELKLNQTSEGIIELPQTAPLGMNLREYLNLDDAILEIGITPNRGDCLSVLGLAREIAAINLCEINTPRIPTLAAHTHKIQNVQIKAQDGCEQYWGRVITNMDTGNKTPAFIADAVTRAGTRLISPVVDITNFVLNEFGQPLHAFDLDTIQGDIIVRWAIEGEKLELLDEQTVTLSSDTLVIADDSGPIAMAGIMGGLKTSITPKTKNIFLESAWFKASAIQGRARKYGLSTDAAFRFERGVDPAITQQALHRAVQLIQDACPGELGLETTVLIDNKTLRTETIILHFTKAEKLLGITLSPEDKALLKQRFEILGLTIKEETSHTWHVLIPTHRSDLHLEVDLIEEVARLYGFQNIPVQPIQAALKAHPILETSLSCKTLSNFLVSRGYFETINYSFVNPEKQALLYPESLSDAHKDLNLLNPLSNEYAQMRRGLWFGLLESALYNQNRQITRLKLFERGTAFRFNGKAPCEEALLSGLITGDTSFEWGTPSRIADFFDLKGDIESLLALTQIDYLFEEANHPTLHPGQCANIIKADTQEYIGTIGMLHPKLQKQWNFSNPVFLFELKEAVITHRKKSHAQKISKFPATRRDISFIVESNISSQTILDTIAKIIKDTLCYQAQTFDVYQGASIPLNHKSLAIALFFQHEERTLLDTEVDDIVAIVMKKLQETLNIQYRV